ncbi:hypothetical protein GCM10017608_02030 [Agromyces luteolus]|uniref:DUF3618 domain-containing protein n=1 Tax=Agromyces luteolus TaxID=88373 RepID=A0A7C9HS69_9MICO|nr:DUF3618 domain-containing protein [Agromyces luteolus]MUN05725.1 DUF3618 domain-containing protein [Agromyces luteolus]GLK26271.1 hypothetical protein GCM10017608_02030 [Agromyces luteolus]
MAATDVVRLDRKQQRNFTRLQAHDNARAARDQLAGTLSALEEKLNVPKRAARATARAKRKMQRFADEQPGAAIALAVGVAAAVGVGVWLVVRANLDR